MRIKKFFTALIRLIFFRKTRETVNMRGHYTQEELEEAKKIVEEQLKRFNEVYDAFKENKQPNEKQITELMTEGWLLMYVFYMFAIEFERENTFHGIDINLFKKSYTFLVPKLLPKS